ncbi:MAG: EAL domain-containing protein [Myxococcales bacterium]|nr:EAL domain-containing protein [Myxococcales bacterium]MCB9533938.1 EAL domain-containing protein [Myxococcales bacterium]
MYTATPILGVPVVTDTAMLARGRAPQLTPDDLKALAIGSTELGVWEWDLRSNEVRYSSLARELLALDSAARSLEVWVKRVHPFDAARVSSALAGARARGGGVQVEHRVRGATGEYRWLKLTARFVAAPGGGERVVGTLEDIDARKSTEVKVRELEVRDPATGLANRAAFLARLDTTRMLSHREGFDAVLYVGLDDFGRVSAGLGQDGVDALIRSAAERLGRWLDRSDVLDGRVTSASLGRVDNDEFAVHLTSVRSGDELQAAAEGLVRLMKQPLAVAEHEVALLAHIGIATSLDATAPAEMLDNARSALTQARNDPRSRVAFYSLAARADALDSVRLASELRSAAARNELFFEYQPLVELRTGRLAGLEALMRWRHPECGIISPARFIPLAEQSELGHDLGLWTVEQVCNQIAEWEEIGLDPDFAVNANLSASHISDPSLPGRVAAMLGAAGIRGERLKLEITESALVPNEATAVAVVRALRLLGVRIAIDDFGTGYSSLGQLHRFEIDVLKIDRSFVRPLDLGESDAIARSIVALAQSLGLGVVAEGIETVQAMQRLAALGCDLGQGFLFSRPVSAATVSSWITQRARAFFETGESSTLGNSGDEVPRGPREQTTGAAALKASPRLTASTRDVPLQQVNGVDEATGDRDANDDTAPPMAARPRRRRTDDLPVAGDDSWGPGQTLRRGLAARPDLADVGPTTGSFARRR